MTVNEAIEFLQARKKSLRADDLRRLLEEFGFRVSDCASGGHKKVSHPGLDGFHGTSYNAGHGSNSQVKPGYPQKIIQVLRQWQSEIEAFMSESKQ